MQGPSHQADAILSSQRRKWFATEMSKNRLSYLQDKQLVLFSGTWNVNGRAPDPNLDITPWLFPRSRDVRQPYDIYMLGLQEVQTLSGVDAVRTDNTRGEAWRNKIESALMSDYDRVAERQLVGIMVFVFLRKNHTPFLSDVQLSYAATGFLNAMGNKGGVAARFKLYNRTISCVACHLAAHIANVERRNQDFTDVVRKAVFVSTEAHNLTASHSATAFETVDEPFPQPLVKKFPASVGEKTATQFSGLPAVAVGTTAWLGSVASVAATAFYDMSAGANTAVLSDPNALKILDHDVVFWLGDLNYRIEAPLQHVINCIEKRDWDSLYQSDQLQRQMKACEIFTGFKEGPLHFAPTYKLERYAEEYACDENGEVKRVPAYTDRILWRTSLRDDDPNGVVNIRLADYSSAQVFCSDHRPVFALFKMTFGVEDPIRRQDVEERVNKELDIRQECYKPALQLSPPFVDFGDVFFDQPCDKSISIRNVGTAPAIFSVSKPNDSEWLVFDDSHWKNVELSPGKSARFSLRVVVNGKNGLANRICVSGCTLEAVLPVIVEPGQLNERIQVRGRYVATTLGLSLETLSMTAEPVLNMRLSRERDTDSHDGQNGREVEQDSNKVTPGGAPLSIPKEIWLLVDALVAAGEGEREPIMNRFPSLFLSEADEAQVQRVLAFIDRAERVPEDLSADAIGCCLLKVLDSLDDAIIPRYAYKRAIEAGYTEDTEVVRGMIELLPPLNGNVFWYIIGFLCTMACIQKQEDRGRAIVVAFGKVLLRTSEGKNARDEKSMAGFMMTAIQFQKHSGQSYSAVMDLGSPQQHPRRLEKIVGPR